MADFCPPCSIEHFGKDYGDIRDCWGLCEGCGEYVLVDATGAILDKAKFEEGLVGNVE
jgi:hypothetical protein